MQQSQPVRSSKILSGKKVLSSNGTVVSNLSKKDNGATKTTTVNPSNSFNEESLCFALGLYRNKSNAPEYLSEAGETEEDERRKAYHPDAEKCDLSTLRGLGNDAQNKPHLNREFLNNFITYFGLNIYSILDFITQAQHPKIRRRI